MTHSRHPSLAPSAPFAAQVRQSLSLSVYTHRIYATVGKGIGARMEAGPSGIRGSVTLRKKDSVAAILGAPLDEPSNRDSFRMSQLIKPGTPIDVRAPRSIFILFFMSVLSLCLTFVRKSFDVCLSVLGLLHASATCVDEHGRPA